MEKNDAFLKMIDFSNKIQELDNLMKAPEGKDLIDVAKEYLVIINSLEIIVVVKTFIDCFMSKSTEKNVDKEIKIICEGWIEILLQRLVILEFLTIHEAKLSEVLKKSTSSDKNSRNTHELTQQLSLEEQLVQAVKIYIEDGLRIKGVADDFNKLIILDAPR